MRPICFALVLCFLLSIEYINCSALRESDDGEDDDDGDHLRPPALPMLLDKKKRAETNENDDEEVIKPRHNKGSKHSVAVAQNRRYLPTLNTDELSEENLKPTKKRVRKNYEDEDEEPALRKNDYEAEDERPLKRSRKPIDESDEDDDYDLDDDSDEDSNELEGGTLKTKGLSNLSVKGCHKALLKDETANQYCTRKVNEIIESFKSSCMNGIKRVCKAVISHYDECNSWVDGFACNPAKTAEIISIISGKIGETSVSSCEKSIESICGEVGNVTLRTCTAAVKNICDTATVPVIVDKCNKLLVSPVCG